jgi:hypothetical protein
MVTIRSVVDPRYAAQRAESKPPKPETYVFAKGEFSRGIAYDSGLERMSFLQMAQMLAVDLKKQNFVPAKSVTNTDLVIVVHWGVTLGRDKGMDEFLFDPDRLRQAAEGMETAQALEEEDPIANSGAVGAAAADFRVEMDIASSMQGSDSVRSATNAELLGLRSAIEKENESLFGSAEADMLRSMIDEERYFIILMAYDGPALRQGKKRRVWITRMSIRAAGVNFHMAIDRMSGAAALLHATPQKRFVMERTKDRKGAVEIGELKVIGESSLPPRQ